MTATAQHKARNRDSQEVLALLAVAEAHIRADRLAEASALYREVMDEPALDQLPDARREVCANYGALLLHEARLITDKTDVSDKLDRAIEMLTRARATLPQRKSVISDTNLALAYFQRHIVTERQSDLMSAHLALDGAEAAIPGDDGDLLDWVRSIRDLLVDHVDRRRNPR